MTGPVTANLATEPAGITHFIAVVPILLIFGGDRTIHRRTVQLPTRQFSLLATAFTCYGAFAVLAATAFLLMSGGALRGQPAGRW